MKYENGGLKNQLAPRNNSPKTNKALLIINAVLFVCSLLISFLYLYHEDYELSVCMLLVAILTAGNTFSAWKRLRKNRERND